MEATIEFQDFQPVTEGVLGAGPTLISHYQGQYRVAPATTAEKTAILTQTSRTSACNNTWPMYANTWRLGET